ncbi:MAG: endonuclease domain-containing protein [Candidatus Marinimicrobia bacterium]|nr:endonuclease domain-containing protein [bacterium]MCG2716479.1 endonuclease domain-containing protein [Candidatus Neomarinimicrobiota bacterium]
MPEAEIILWSKLKGKQIYGYKFRRQYSVGSYIVDFYCPKLKLAIEVDGMSHLQQGSETRDNERQKYIETYGIQFLRYINTDIHENLEGVIEQIGETIHELEGKRNILNSPLEKGE